MPLDHFAFSVSFGLTVPSLCCPIEVAFNICINLKKKKKNFFLLACAHSAASSIFGALQAAVLAPVCSSDVSGDYIPPWTKMNVIAVFVCFLL